MRRRAKRFSTHFGRSLNYQDGAPPLGSSVRIGAPIRCGGQQRSAGNRRVARGSALIFGACFGSPAFAGAASVDPSRATCHKLIASAATRYYAHEWIRRRCSGEAAEIPVSRCTAERLKSQWSSSYGRPYHGVWAGALLLLRFQPSGHDESRKSFNLGSHNLVVLVRR
jgi:hypothetical protein